MTVERDRITTDDGDEAEVLRGRHARFYFRGGQELEIKAEEIVVMTDPEDGRLIGITYNGEIPSVGFVRVDDVSAVVLHD
jgi:hypothetical protein